MAAMQPTICKWCGALAMFVALHTKKEQIMSLNQKRAAISRMFSVLGDAIAVSAAVEAHRQPHPRNLSGLGIDPEQFRSIGRF